MQRHELVLDNGSKFYIRRYDAFLALRVLGDVQKKFLAPIALFMEANDQSLPAESRDNNMQAAVTKISTSLDGDSLVELTRKVLNPEYVSVSVDGEPPEKLDEGMLNRATDSVFDVVRVVIEVLRFNYEDLFTRGRSLIGQVQSPPAIH